MTVDTPPTHRLTVTLGPDCWIYPDQSPGVVRVKTRVNVDGEEVWATAIVPARLLDKVEPPLPPEPPMGAVVTLTPKRPAERVFSRDDESSPYKSEPWFGEDGWWSWEEICSLGTPVRLVPDPFAEPVELPWVHAFEEGEPIKVWASSASNRAAYVEGWGHLAADDARDMAKALWAAADQAEAAS